MKPLAHMLPDPLPADPMPLAATWLSQAWDEQVQPNPNAMVLATADTTGRPTARVVLCKDIVVNPGYLLFYTNYTSVKGRELEFNPQAAAVFHWDVMERQLRIEGRVVHSPASESDDYFASRPWRSRIGAWASQQSQPVANRHAMIEQLRESARKLGAPDPLDAPDDDEEPDFHVPRPPHWGGMRLWAEAVELWVEGDHRIHDRARWTRSLVPDDNGVLRPGVWHHTRLQP
ncbi:MAG: pyridoxamine 5'-phosphate oxidase [Gammaproteobacteria bacterium]|nr:pyridoxamine 5'-phosphate oxidase [Gammaproteobacteria bacterium]